MRQRRTEADLSHERDDMIREQLVSRGIRDRRVLDDGIAENRDAWRGLERFRRPVLTLFSDSDPITKGLEKELVRRVPGAHGQPHEIIEGAGHFVLEDAPYEVAKRVVAFALGQGAPPASMNFDRH